MIENIDLLPDNMSLEADVCIVGTGAAGLMMALEFMDAGVQVVMLEGGGLNPAQDAQNLYAGEVKDDAFRGLQAGRSREFGGTTRLWGGQCIRLDPIDFERRAWVPGSGWPISYETLAPFYDRAQSRLGVAAKEFAPNVWGRFGLEVFDLNPDELNAVHGVFIRRSKLGRQHRATFEAARNVRVLLRANVTRIGTNDHATAVSHVEFRGLSGRSGQVRAKYVVLCAGGIENARLLLLSDDVHPAGLGNGRDLVGRHLQDHPCGRTASITTSNPRRLQDHFNMLYGRGAFLLPKVALAEAAQRREQALNCVGRLSYEYDQRSGMKALRDLVVDIHQRKWPEQLSSKLMNVALAAPMLAPNAWRLLRHGLSPAPRPSRIWLESFSEQTPNPDSRVMLSDTTDVLGLRRVKIDWRLDALTGHTLRTFTNVTALEFARLGLGTVTAAEWLEDDVPSYPNVMDSYHPTGATRMAASPDQGVVDTNCQVFGVNGLYIAGSSVFPTSGAANPTFSIAALALRLAEHIKRTLREPVIPVIQTTKPSLAPAGAH